MSVCMIRGAEYLAYTHLARGLSVANICLTCCLCFSNRQVLEVLAALYQMDKFKLAEMIYKTTCTLFKWKSES